MIAGILLSDGDGWVVGDGRCFVQDGMNESDVSN